MAERMIDKLIEAVKAIKENPSSEVSVKKEDSSMTTEEALGNLFPSISGTSSSRRSGVANRYNPKANYVPKKGVKRFSSSSSSSCSHSKRKTPDVKSKSLLKDFILLPGPHVENVPRGRFREYLYGNGFAESAVTVDDHMSEEDVKNKVGNIFKDKLALLPRTENSFVFVRAIGNKIVKVNNGPFTGKLLKHISKQGPVYVRTVLPVPGADLKGWAADKSEESSDDDCLMPAPFEMSNDKVLVGSQSMHKPVEVIDDENVETQEALVSKSAIELETYTESTCSKEYGNRWYDKYIEILEDDEEEDMQYALRVSLEESENIDTKPLESDVYQLLEQHRLLSLKSQSPNEIIVRRSKLLETAFVAMKSKRFDCCENLIVQFSGEDAIDEGGPRREFFRLARHEIVQSSGLFEGRDGRNLMFTHNLKLLEENRYCLAGRLVGMSLMHGGPAFGCLDGTVYELMCGTPCNLSEFDISLIANYEMADMLSKLKQLESEEEFKSFVQENADNIASQGYSSIYVAKVDQREVIVKALIKQHILYRVSSEIEQFKNGINDVGGLWDVIKMHSKEFKPLFTEVPEKLSRGSFKAIYEIEWSPQGSNSRAQKKMKQYIVGQSF